MKIVKGVTGGVIFIILYGSILTRPQVGIMREEILQQLHLKCI